jgi:NLI interacting factor-like phosphatase
LILDLNGVLIDEGTPPRGSYKKPLVVRDGVGPFLKFCVENFWVSFWSCCRGRKMDVLLAEIQKHCEVSLEFCKKFDQYWCDTVTKADGSALGGDKPYFLKTLATIFNSPDGLRDTSACAENTLLVDDSPYKNVRNNMWNAVHPEPFIGAHPERYPGYLLRELMPWLRRLKESGQTVPEYCRNNPRFGHARLQEGDAMYTAMAHSKVSGKMVHRGRV